MLLRADPNTNTISMLSFPRDLIVNGRCPDGRTYVGRINAAYSFCGPAGTLETVRSLTDLPIHYLITVNFQGFRDIVDKLGGVWMDVDRRYYNPTGGVVRDDQPLARLPEAQGLAGARLRPLPAHGLGSLPPGPPAAVREGGQAGGQPQLEEPEDGSEAVRE